MDFYRYKECPRCHTDAWKIVDHDWYGIGHRKLGPTQIICVTCGEDCYPFLQHETPPQGGHVAGGEGEGSGPTGDRGNAASNGSSGGSLGATDQPYPGPA